jgi:hypothetical protein
MCEIPLETGHHIAAYAYFNISNYKFSLQKELRTKDLSETIPWFSSPPLKAHIVLIRHVTPVSRNKPELMSVGVNTIGQWSKAYW